MAQENKKFLVRIKPFNPKKGYKIQRYMAFGIKFEEARGWYKIGEYIVRYSEENEEEQDFNFVQYLKSVRNNNEDPDSPLAFDVCTPEEAQALQAAEKAAKEAAIAKAENPHPIDLMASEKKSRVSGDDAVTRVPSSSPAKPKRPRGRPPKAKPVQATEQE